MHLLDAKYLKTQGDIIMLLPKDINPETSIYYYGSIVLKQLKVAPDKQEDIITLYHNLKHVCSISITSFSLTLDWLYMIDTVKINSEGKVILCS